MEHIIPVVVGVDVGGTNTDAVVLEMEKNPPEVLSSAKYPTTHDVFTGITNAITDAINSSLKQQQSVGIVQVNIGTTHFVNAVIQKRDLAKVAVIRLCGTASRGTPPFCDFPDDLKQYIFGGYYMVAGGYEFDGRENSSLNLEEVEKCLNELESKNICNIVVCGIFSSVNQEQEIKVRDFIKKTKPNFTVTISNEIGQNGLLLRENASILNESLKPLCQKTIQGFRHALESLKLQCPFYLTQNDGTILSADQAEEYPVLTFSSGPTNSMRGAAFLCGIEDAVVVDIGGTTTDVGVLCKGFPREASFIMEIGNVRTNFRMPDVLSIGLGGGSYIAEEQNNGPITVGPLSAGYNIRNEGLVFSDGSMENRRMTATDIAVAGGLCMIGEPKYVMDLDKKLISKALSNIKHTVENAVDKMKTSSEEVPVILVGGGCVILDKTNDLAGASRLISPTHADVANAIGAALSQVSNTIEYVVNLEDKIDVDKFDSEIEKIGATDDSTREKLKAIIRKKHIENAHVVAMEEACKKATDGILQLGVKESSVKIIEKMDVPIAYLPGNATKIKVKVTGDLVVSHEKMSIIKTSLPKEPSPPHSVSQRKKQSITSSGKNIFHSSENPYKQSEPTINNNNEWMLSERDIECIAIGAGILGCGGGGSPYLGRVMALKSLREGKTMRVLNCKDFYENASLDDLVLSVEYMGAPAIADEKTVSGETVTAFSCMFDLFATGKYKEGILGNTEGVEVKGDESLTYIDDYQPKSVTCISTDRKLDDLGGKRIAALLTTEIGGMNSIEPLLVGAQMNLPVLDCDGMGRAFPELQMVAPLIYGCPSYPSTLADDKGRRAVVLKVDTPKHLEDHFRKVVVEMGCSAGVLISHFNKEQILRTMIPNSLSRTWFIGNSVLRARMEQSSPVDSILAQTKGKHLVTGKISMVRRETTDGFNKGYLIIEGFDEDREEVKIDFQNENLVARRLNAEHGHSGEVIGCVPDLITVLESESGEPVPTESVRYGLRVSVLLLPAPSLLKTEKALQVVGPEAFGYTDVKYEPFSDFDENRSVITEYSKR